MPDFEIAFEAETQHLQGVLRHLDQRLNPDGLGDYLEAKIEPFLQMRIDARFAAEGDDVTGAWHPLKQATEMIRASKGFPPAHPINVRTNKMKHWLVNVPADLIIGGDEAVLIHPPFAGPSDAKTREKIQTAQQGKRSPNTPPRPVLGVNENDLLFITSELVAWITEGYI